MLNPSFLTLGQAAKEVGKSKATLSTALKSGKLSYVRKTKAGYEIDPAELFRVYPPNTLNSKANRKTERYQTPAEQQSNTNENKSLERENKLLREMLEKTEVDRDQWRQQAQNITALIEHRQEKSKGLWARIIGK